MFAATFAYLIHGDHDVWIYAGAMLATAGIALVRHRDSLRGCLPPHSRGTALFAVVTFDAPPLNLFGPDTVADIRSALAEINASPQRPGASFPRQRSRGVGRNGKEITRESESECQRNSLQRRLSITNPVQSTVPADRWRITDCFSLQFERQVINPEFGLRFRDASSIPIRASASKRIRGVPTRLGNPRWVIPG